ncbi:MAG: hypothetical protein ABI806_18655 [Candidatus Solibacter sp.]
MASTLLTGQNQIGEPDPFAGAFEGDGATLELTASGGAYAGTLGIRGSHFPATFRVAGSLGTGSYEVNGQARTFTLAREANGLLLESGGTAYRLARKASSVLPPASPEDIQAAGGLVGSWRNATSSAQFNSDGTGIVNGTAGRFEIRGTRLTLIGAQAQTTVRFELHSDILALTVNGKPVTLNRVKDEAGEGSVRVELVGRWCWTSLTAPTQENLRSKQCFTLNGNGTYAFATAAEVTAAKNATKVPVGDSGTWTATDSILTTHSVSGKATTYQLSKRNHPGKVRDPMIVLDGQAYVTFFNKAPW